MPAVIFENEFIRQGISFRNELKPQLRYVPEFGMTRIEIIKEIMNRMGWNQGQLAQEIAVGQGTISKWINDNHAPNTSAWDRVENLIMRDSRLRDLAPKASENTEVRVMGFIGAGGDVDPDAEQVPPEGLESVELPFPVRSDLIALRVSGESMLPYYPPGTIVLVWPESHGDLMDLIGQLAAVRTKDGSRYLKTIEYGSKRGLFNLSSPNGPLIRDVKLEWWSPIHTTVAGNQVRKATRKPLRATKVTEKHRTAGRG